LNQNSNFFRGVCFIKLFDLRPPYICFWFFGTLVIFSEFKFLVFWKFWNCILKHISHFRGVSFINLFDLRPCYMCFWYFGNLGVFFYLDFWFLKILKLYFDSEFPLLGGLFYKTFLFKASLYMVLIFWNFRGSFLSLFFGFWKFQNCILNHNSHF